MPYLFPEIDESVDIGFELAFPNRIIVTDGGAEQRIVPHQSPLRTYSFVKKIVNSAAIATIFNFYSSLSGATNAFGYRDKSDYLASNDIYMIAPGVYTRGVVVASGSGRYQLCKLYACGSNAHYRPIWWATNLTIYQGGSPVTGWTLLEGGEITGLSGTEHTAKFTFYTKVRFSEGISRALATSKSPAIYSLNNVQLLEVRHDIPFQINDVFNDDINLTLSSDTRDSLSSNIPVEINKLPSGFEKRQRRGVEMTTLNFGTFSLANQKSLDYLLCFWLNTKGSGAFFDFEDLSETIVKARFGQDGEQESKMTYSLRVGGKIPYYEVSGLSARLFYEGAFAGGSAGGWVGSVLTLCDCVKFFNLYTTHDRPIVIEGMLSINSEAIAFTAIEQDASLDPNNAEIIGVQGSIPSTLITNQLAQSTEIILLKGVNWRSLPATFNDHPASMKQIGQVGETFSMGETMWSIQVQDSIKRKLSQQIIKVTSPLCLHRFCDAGCTLNAANYTFDTAIATVSGQTQFQLVKNDLDFSFGTVTFLSGANTGLSFGIASGVNGAINLTEIPGERVASGDQVRVFRGCEKTPEYCKTQFGNYVNFLGIPTGGNWIPGVDAYQNPGVRRE